MDIPAGSVVGIAGRTGSGKSSLVLTLLRLLIPSSGTVLIDGVDIATLPGDVVRAKVTTIPQDPYFPPNRTLRHSLSSQGAAEQHQDSEILEALQKVGLLPHIVSHLGGGEPAAIDPTADPTTHLSPEAATRVLAAEMKDLPLSAGQLQLFALAHALLQRHRRLVVLDEVTSAMDRDTEARFRAVLRDGEAFRGRTVVMVAHRPEMLALCDAVVEMDAGRVVGVARR